LEEFRKTYWSKEVSEGMDIGQSTLRKWCIELEKNGYNFTKGAMDSRIFTDQDVAALNYFKQLTKAKKHTRDQAAKFVVQRFLRNEDAQITGVSMGNIRSIENMIKQMLAQQKEVLMKLDRIEQEIKNNDQSEELHKEKKQ
jgi:transposase-like protein